MKSYLLTIVSLCFFTLCAFSQKTSEQWKSITTDSTTFKVPAKDVRQPITGVENLRAREDYEPLFVGGIIKSHTRYKASGEKIRSSLIILSGNVDFKNSKIHLQRLTEVIKEEIPTEILLVKEEIKTTDSEAELFIRFKGTKELMTIIIKMTHNKVIVLALEDVSENGTETDYFISEFTYHNKP